MKINNALVIIAHQDDETIGCGGTIRKWYSQGKKVHVICVSDGKTGVDHSRSYEDNIVSTRNIELKKAASLLGFSYEGFGKECQNINNDVDLFHKLIASIRTYRPDVILTHSHQDKHRDHRSICEAVKEAAWKAHEDIHPELGPIWKTKDVWGIEVLDPHPHVDYVVDISCFFDTKLSALSLYQSQANILDGLASYVEGIARVRGYAIGVEYGEGFKRISKEPVEI